jgi:hypothetical protein
VSGSNQPEGYYSTTSCHTKPLLIWTQRTADI